MTETETAALAAGETALATYRDRIARVVRGENVPAAEFDAVAVNAGYGHAERAKHLQLARRGYAANQRFVDQRWPDVIARAEQANAEARDAARLADEAATLAAHALAEANRRKGLATKNLEGALAGRAAAEAIFGEEMEAVCGREAMRRTWTNFKLA